MKKLLFGFIALPFAVALTSCNNNKKTITVVLSDSTKMVFEDRAYLALGDTVLIARSKEEIERPSRRKWHISNDNESKKSEGVKGVIVRKTNAVGEKDFMTVALPGKGNVQIYSSVPGLEEGDIVLVTKRIKGSGTDFEKSWHLVLGNEDQSSFEYAQGTIVKK